MKPFLLALFAVSLIVPAHATVIWALNGVAFDDGGTASGTFGFDENTDTFSAVNIVTTAGSVLGGTTYSTADVANSSNTQLVALALPEGLVLSFNSGLTDLGGSILLASGTEGTCGDPDCGGINSPFRSVVSGEVDATPEPASWQLVLLGGLLLPPVRSRLWSAMGKNRNR